LAGNAADRALLRMAGEGHFLAMDAEA